MHMQTSVSAGDAMAFTLPGNGLADGWWHELNCRDSRAAISFYGRVLNWRFEEVPLRDGSRYHLARQGEWAVCGILEMDEARHGDLPDHWMAYMRTPDLDAALRAASLAGGEILRAPLVVPMVGRLALISDAGGAMMGLLEAGSATDDQGQAP